MKQTASIICILVGLLAGNTSADEAALPADVLANRARYEVEMAAALKPIRQRYIAQLESAKKAATSRGDLKGAVAIEAELKSMLEYQNADEKTAILCGSLWKNRIDTWEFFPDGRLVQRGEGMAGKSWKFASGRTTVEMYFENGKKQVSTFKNGVLMHFDPAWGAFTKLPRL